MWEIVGGLIEKEPVAAIGFVVTWGVALVATLAKYFRARHERRERIADLLTDARVLASQTLISYTRMYGYIDRLLAKNGALVKDSAKKKFLEVRNEASSRADKVSELQESINVVDTADVSRANLLRARGLKNESRLRLSTSQEMTDLLKEFLPTEEELIDAGERREVL